MNIYYSLPLQVLYPDGQSHVIHPKPGDFRKPGPHRHRLITQVYLSHTAWTGQFFLITFSCALNIKLSNETELNIQTSKNSRSSSLCFLLSCLCLRAVSDRGASPAGLQLLLNLPDLPFQAGVERELGEPPGSRGCRRGNHSV